MLSSNNILSPASGVPVTIPSQDMVLGLYYLTSEREVKDKKVRYYNSINEALLDQDFGHNNASQPYKGKNQ